MTVTGPNAVARLTEQIRYSTYLFVIHISKFQLVLDIDQLISPYEFKSNRILL
jgi:hypothetical protein